MMAKEYQEWDVKAWDIKVLEEDYLKNNEEVQEFSLQFDVLDDS